MKQTIYTARIAKSWDGSTVAYAVEIDFSMLDQLALKAAKNKSKRSKDGPVEVRVVGVRAADKGVLHA